MSVKSQVVRVKQLVPELSTEWDRREKPAGPGGLGSTKDYYFLGGYGEGKDEAIEWFVEQALLYEPTEFDVSYHEIPGPHEGDPLFQDGQDVGHGLKIQDPSDCEIWAWDWPFDLPVDELQKALWVQLTFCRPGFEDAEDWSYEVVLWRGEFDKEVDIVDAGADWSKARQAIIDFRRRSSALAPALALINRRRREMGMAPLDPVAAGWTDDDVLREAQRLQRGENPRGLQGLKRRLLR